MDETETNPGRKDFQIFLMTVVYKPFLSSYILEERKFVITKIKIMYKFLEKKYTQSRV
jgi:hypothetical protein